MHIRTLASRIALGSLLLGVSVPALCQNDEVLRAAEPGWVQPIEPITVPPDPRGVVFFRRQQTQVHLGADTQQTYNGFRVKLLHPNALQLGNIAITWNPAAGSPTVHNLKIHRDGETLDVLADHEFEILRREGQLEAAMLDGMLTATMQIADLRIGDELELSYTLPTGSPTLADRDFGLLYLADAPPPGRFRLGLSWDEGSEPQIRLTEDLEQFIERGDRVINIGADSPGTINAPKDAPPRYSWQRILEFSDFDSWSAVSQRFYGLFAQARTLDEGSSVKLEAARIAQQHPDTMARANAALELVARQVRYIYVGLNAGALTPANAEETWQRRYGDCKGKTALLLALLDELGIEAEAVVASNAGLDDALNQRLPNPGLFDHILVRAQIGGETYWLDGTFPAVAKPSLRPLPPYRWVLPLAEAGADLERIEWQPDAQPRSLVLYEIDAREGFDAPAQIRQKTIARGPAALGEYLQYSAVTDEQLENAYRNQLSGSTSWNTVDEVTWRFDAENQASILEIVGTGPIDWESRSGDRKSLTLPGGGFSPPQRRQRNTEQDQEAPFWKETDFDCYVTTVRLPADTRASQWSYNTTFDTNLYGTTYRRGFERRDMEIRMIRASRVELNEISRQLADSDNARLTDFDNSMARIEFDPFDSFQPDDQMPVPATYEVDWLNDASACQSRAGDPG